VVNRGGVALLIILSAEKRKKERGARFEERASPFNLAKKGEKTA